MRSMGSRRASTKLKHFTFQVQKYEKPASSMFYSDSALVDMLKSCAKHKNLIKGKKVHRFLLEKGLLGKNAHVTSSLINMYSKCGALSKAKEIFDQISSPNVVTWNALIAGYAQNGHGQMALDYFQQMLSYGPSPNAVTFVCALKSCGSIKAIDQGEYIHRLIVKEGLHKSNLLIGNALIDMYAKCGKLAKAEQVFNELITKDIISWNSLINGYAEHGSGEEVFKYADLMHQSGLPASVVTFISTLKACGILKAAEKGQEIHTEIVRRRMLKENNNIGTALVDMYIKCGLLTKSLDVFNELPCQDLVSWTAVIAGFAHNGYAKEALNHFKQMRRSGLSPNSFTYSCILTVCSSLGAKKLGEDIHKEILQRGMLEDSIFVCSALIDMYAKCGSLVKAHQIFNELSLRDVVVWNALIAGYAQRGKADTVCLLFEQMINDHINPNLVTFTLVLNACSHSGLLTKGQIYFEAMHLRYGIAPTSEHYACMVTLFGRAGYFSKAVALIKDMPDSDYLPVWTSLLGSCQKWGKVKLGRWAFEHVIQLNKTDATAYVCMSNIYAAAAMPDEVRLIETMKIKNEAW